MTEQVLRSCFYIFSFPLLGPKTNWIVGTRTSDNWWIIGVDSNAIIIDKLTDSGEVRDLT